MPILFHCVVSEKILPPHWLMKNFYFCTEKYYYHKSENVIANSCRE